MCSAGKVCFLRTYPRPSPEMLIPYSSYSLRFVLTVLEDYFLHVHTVEQICETYQIAHSTLYVFRNLFLSHKQLILGILNDAQGKHLISFK